VTVEGGYFTAAASYFHFEV